MQKMKTSKQPISISMSPIFHSRLKVCAAHVEMSVSSLIEKAMTSQLNAIEKQVAIANLAHAVDLPPPKNSLADLHVEEHLVKGIRNCSGRSPEALLNEVLRLGLAAYGASQYSAPKNLPPPITAAKAPDKDDEDYFDYFE